MKKHLPIILFTLLSLSAFSQEQRKEYIVQSNPFLVGEVYKTYRFEDGKPVEVIPNLRLEKTYDVQVTTAHKENIKIYTVGDKLYVLSEIDLKKVKRGEQPLPEPLMTFTLEEEFFISLRNEQNVGTSVAYLREGLEGNSTLQTKAYKLEETKGNKRYELADHLGNVQVTVTDKLIPMTIGNGLDIQKYYTASVISASDYYPFGMAIANRSQSSPLYRYGFNGKERDVEGLGGGGNVYDYGFRIYNPSIAKFLSVDPLSPDYPWYTPYQFAGNNPILFIDLDGLEQAQSGNLQITGGFRMVFSADGVAFGATANLNNSLHNMTASYDITKERGSSSQPKSSVVFAYAPTITLSGSAFPGDATASVYGMDLTVSTGKVPLIPPVTIDETINTYGAYLGYSSDSKFKLGILEENINTSFTNTENNQGITLRYLSIGDDGKLQTSRSSFNSDVFAARMSTEQAQENAFNKVNTSHLNWSSNTGFQIDNNYYSVSRDYKITMLEPNGLVGQAARRYIQLGNNMQNMNTGDFISEAVSLYSDDAINYSIDKLKQTTAYQTVENYVEKAIEKVIGKKEEESKSDSSSNTD